MKKNIIDKALHTLYLRRLEAENQAFNNKVKALSCPEFKEIYNDYIDSMISDSKTNGTLTEKTISKKQKVKEKLNELNIENIEPKYFCEKCNDTGYVDGEQCDCLIKEINKVLRKNSGFDHLESFDQTSFEICDNKEYAEKLYSKMKEWCHSDFNKNLIFISGDTGVGKTHLTKCMANELINLNRIVFLTSSFAMHQDFVKSYSTRNLDEKNDLIDKYLSADILFIDDLGTELRMPNITVNYLYQVINERKINKRPTIITSNLDLYDIKDYYDERISSRIIDTNSSICVCIKGNDLRMKK